MTDHLGVLQMWGFDEMWAAVMEQPARAIIFADWLDEHGQAEKAIVVRECVMAARGQNEFLRRLLQLFFGKVSDNEILIRIVDHGNGIKTTSLERPEGQLIWTGASQVDQNLRVSVGVVFGSLVLHEFIVHTAAYRPSTLDT